MIRILHVVSELDGGGVEKFLYNYCCCMKENINFDFLICSKTEGILEKPLRDFNFNIYKMKPIRQSLIKNITRTYKIIQNGQYDIVHVHTGYKAIIPLLVASVLGVKVRIAHSHQAYTRERLTTKTIRIIITPMSKLFATNLFACGRDAAIFTWGKRAYDLEKVTIIHNAIDINMFKFSEDIREKIRKKLDLEGKYVIGNVARFSSEKNHNFLLKIFAIIIKSKKNAVLLLVGRGELEEAVKKQAQYLGLSDSVIFLGVRDDVHDLLNAMDIFLLPSLNEGLPVTLIEAQANGLITFVSDKVTKEIQITDIIKFLELDEGVWANEILTTIHSDEARGSYASNVQKKGYDINLESNSLKEKYCTMLQH